MENGTNGTNGTSAMNRKPDVGAVRRAFRALFATLSAFLAAGCLRSDAADAFLCFFFPVFLCLTSVFAVRLLSCGDTLLFGISVAGALIAGTLLRGAENAVFSLGGFAAAALLYAVASRGAARQVGAVCVLIAVNSAFYVAALIYLVYRKYGLGPAEGIPRAYTAFSDTVLRFVDEIGAMMQQIAATAAESGAAGLTDAQKTAKAAAELRELCETMLDALRYAIPGDILALSAVSGYLTMLSYRRLMRDHGLPDGLGLYRISNVSLFLFVALWLPGFFVSGTSVAGCVIGTVLSPLLLGMALQGYLFLYAASSYKRRGWLCVLITVLALVTFPPLALYALAAFGAMGLFRLFMMERILRARDDRDDRDDRDEK